MKNLLHGGTAVGSYLISGIAFLTHASEWVGVLSGIAGAFVTVTLGLRNYAEYRDKMTDIRIKEAQAGLNNLEKH
jgi:hypothetical protein